MPFDEQYRTNTNLMEGRPEWNQVEDRSFIPDILFFLLYTADYQTIGVPDL